MSSLRRRAVALLAAATMAACGGPSVRGAEAPRTVLSADFAVTDPAQVQVPGDSAVLTAAPDEVVGGRRSLKGDSRASAAEWNEFFHSKAGLFAPHEAYRISFDYKVLARADNARFYALLRRPDASGSQGWTEWQGSPGATGHIQTTLVARRAGDYLLVIGIQHQGALAINNLVIRTDPAQRPREAALPTVTRTWRSPGHRTYYLDSMRGRNTNAGTSPARPWRSLARINRGVLGPGDRILLRAGSTWTGFLAPGGSGTADAPIVLDRYGAGPKPRLDARGQSLATVFLGNVEHWTVRNLDIANRAAGRIPDLAGVQVRLEDFGTAHGIRLAGLDVHDVTGSNIKSEGGGSGINCSCGGSRVRSRYEGLIIEDCHLVRTDRNGITLDGSWERRNWYPSLHVVIRRNLLEDFGGDGIVPIACDGARIEHNTLRGGRRRARDAAAGIWPWSCDNTVVQFNDVSGMRGTNDGEGYDSDWNCRGTLFQYNLSHDNDGGFMLVCNDGSSKMPYSLGNVGTVIRYNVSINDGLHTFNITGPCRDTSIYNNVFYVGGGRSVQAVASGNWGGAWSENTRFANNLFFVAGRAAFDFGGMTGTTFAHNAFWGTFENRPPDAHAITADPRLVAPGSLTAAGYRPRPGSPCLGAGVPFADSGGRDFGGNPVPPDAPPNIGAWQSEPAQAVTVRPAQLSRGGRRTRRRS